MLVVMIDPETVAALVAFTVAGGEILREVKRRRERKAAEHAQQETIMQVLRLAHACDARPARMSACPQTHTEALSSDTAS
ncbi:hypothetical protein [Planomonospora venezuelensis]|uniref:Uncharacterized protein n=1 Tax=Planomonospora venezuelensis TaxID=1999 RepID=A0A841DFR7_PLAVE|nr:hypothetical protein [Planomonospora venezuelensis]MBB5967234.1 hypothetical protein [Planomonospora venezuelensis]